MKAIVIIIVAFLLAILASDSVAQQCPGNRLLRRGCSIGDCDDICDQQKCRSICIGSRTEDCCCNPCSSTQYKFNSRFDMRNARGRGRKRSTDSESITVSEDFGNMTICGVGTFTGIDAANITIVVIIGAQPGTASENADYDPSMIPNQISFNISNNGTEQCFDVMIIDDNGSEDTENFMLTFDTPLNSQAEDPLVTLSPRMFDVAITDNDEGSSAGKVNAGVLIIFVAMLGWFFNHV